MGFLYKKEHVDCPNYDNTGKLMAEVREFVGQMEKEVDTKQNKVVFMLEGKLNYCDSIIGGCVLEEGNMAFIRFGSHLVLENLCDRTKVLIIRLSQNVRFCERYLLSTLMNQVGDTCLEPYCDLARNVLIMNQEIRTYAANFAACINKKLCCLYYLKIKVEEFFYLLRSFYSKEKLALFFKEILNEDSSFHHFVVSNYYKYNTLSQMAEDMNMTLWTIEKKFKEVFGTSGYRWMTEQKAAKIYQVICTEDTPLKVVASEFGFSSMSSFSNFCRKNLSNSPGRIRAGIKAGNNDG